MSKKFKFRVNSRLLKKRVRKQSSLAKKQCRFCGDQERSRCIDYKNVNLLKTFLTERYKILSVRISGNCYFHQRKVANHIKIARTMALLPFCAVHHI